MKYFAYGSNMNSARMLARIQREPAFSVGYIIDYALTFNKQASKKPGIGYANIEPSAGGRVWGLLCDLDEQELSVIDTHEAVKTKNYYRKDIDVFLSGNVEKAVAYIACPDKTRDGLLPERENLNHLLAVEAVLPLEYVQALRRQPTFD